MDLIISSIPFAAVAELPNDLFDPVLQHVPVIDTGNVFEPLYQALYPHWSGSVEESRSLGLRRISKCYAVRTKPTARRTLRVGGER